MLGVDFTSAPRRAKPIVAARGHLHGGEIVLDAIESFPDWNGFEALLARPGPWLGAFDFPFGLPREAAVDLGWPQDWPALVAHCHALGRAAFRAALDAYREARAPGRRYAHRATDHAARSHSPLKLVNPPEADLVRSDDGLFRLQSGGVAPADGNVVVAPAAIEGSNVNAVEQMIALISHARAFETHMRMLQNADQNDRQANQLLSLNR